MSCPPASQNIRSLFQPLNLRRLCSACLSAEGWQGDWAMALRNIKDDGLWRKGYGGVVRSDSDFDPTGISRKQLMFFYSPYICLYVSLSWSCWLGLECSESRWEKQLQSLKSYVYFVRRIIFVCEVLSGTCEGLGSWCCLNCGAC